MQLFYQVYVCLRSIGICPQSQVKTTSAPVGPDFKPTGPGAPPQSSGASMPPRPTFPAYSQPPSTTSSAPTKPSTSIAGAPTIKKPESSSGMSIKLVHPDEDISLEERRAGMPKYKNIGPGRMSAPPVSAHQSNPTSMAPPPMGMPPGKCAYNLCTNRRKNAHGGNALLSLWKIS